MKRTPLRPIGRRGQARLVSRRRFYEAVRARANGTCERCRRVVGYYRIDAHHRVMRSRGGSDDAATNGAGLCRVCHRLIHDHNCEDWRDWFEPRQEPDGF